MCIESGGVVHGIDARFSHVVAGDRWIPIEPQEQVEAAKLLERVQGLTPRSSGLLRIWNPRGSGSIRLNLHRISALSLTRRPG